MFSAADDQRLLHELLGPLHMHFRAARAAYADYLGCGRTFLFASSLRRLNVGARRLLLSKGHLLPEPLRVDALALVRHWDVWLTLWEDLEERSSPRPEDSFIFENDIVYPREAEGRLERLYSQMSGADPSARVMGGAERV